MFFKTVSLWSEAAFFFKFLFGPILRPWGEISGLSVNR